MHWDVVFSKQIEDYVINSQLGLINWDAEKEDCRGLNSLVNERIKDSEWYVPRRSRIVHGVEDGAEIYAQELWSNDQPPPHWSKSDEEMYQVVSAPILSSTQGIKGLIEIVNKEVSMGWSLGRKSSFDYNLHNGDPCWHIRLFGPYYGGVTTS